MAKLNVNIGLSVNDKTGDTLRTAFDKINQNFTELYTLTGGTSTALTELAQDYAAPMFNHASHTNITATYDDANNKILLTGSAAQVQSNWTATTGLGVILNKPSIPTSFDRLVNGAHQLVLNVTGTTPYVTFPAVSGSNVYIQGGEINVDGIGVASAALLTSLESYVKLSANAAGIRKEWKFGTNGSLTFPDDTVQTTAFTGTGNIGFRNDTIFDLAGLAINNSNTTTASTAGITIPVNGSGAVSIANNTKTWGFDSTGNTTFPTGLVLGAPRGVGTVNFTCSVDKEFQIETGTANAGRLWQFGTAGNTIFPSGLTLHRLSTPYSNITADLDKILQIATQTSGGRKEWSFGTDGSLTLPAGGTITEGVAGNGGIKLKPAGGANAYQALVIYPTANPDGDHLHLTTAGGTTELYLGSDTHYVKLVNGGNVEVRASTANLSAQAAWTFETDGELDTIKPLGIKVPNGVPSVVATINSSSVNWMSNPMSNLATTGGSGSGLRVNVNSLSDAADIISIATPGTGYNNGDLITVTSGTSSATFTIVIGGRNTWTFGVDGKLTAPGNLQVNGGKLILNTGGNAYVESVDYGVNSANSAVNIFGGPYQKIKLRAGFGTEAIWTLSTNGQMIFPQGTGLFELITGPTNTFGIFANAVVGRSVTIRTSPLSGINKDWVFGADGSLTFPDYTVQSTAYLAPTTGNSVISSIGPLTISRNGMTIRVTSAGMIQMSFDSVINITGRSSINNTSSQTIASPNGATVSGTQYNVSTSTLALGDHLTATIVDASFHRIYRLTVIMRDKDTTPGLELAVAYAIIEQIQ